MDLGIIHSDTRKYTDISIKTSFKHFLKRNESYRYRFLQSKYNSAFDGYSYIGQKDSLNQYSTDMLHSFVLSNFTDIDEFPKEFHNFLLHDWEKITIIVRQYETEILKKINNSTLNHLYKNDAIGYMMSCNYYPKTNSLNFVAKNNTRLSMHKDVSLFTTFPFGISQGFTYFRNKDAITLGARNNIFTFAGYFMEFSTKQAYSALNHQVNLPVDSKSERYSFAIFSIPKPNAKFNIGKHELTGREYYNKYLSLF